MDLADVPLTDEPAEWCRIRAAYGDIGVDVGIIIAECFFEPGHFAAHRCQRRSDRILNLDENLAAVLRWNEFLADDPGGNEQGRAHERYQAGDNERDPMAQAPGKHFMRVPAAHIAEAAFERADDTPGLPLSMEGPVCRERRRDRKADEQ